MNKSLLLLTTTIAFTPVVYAQDLSWGDPKAEAGQVKVSGAIRTRYLSKDFQDEANEGSNNNWRLADIKLNLNYENPKWLAALDARCYEYDELCDAVFLSDAWVGYKISDQQRVSVGLQPVEFGFGRFWGSSYYETLMNTVGFEDISALGLRYQISQNDYSLSLGFYPTDGGNYKGTSKDSSRYSPAFVEADDLTTGTYLKERNIWIGRLSKKFEVTPIDGLSTEIGTSFWHSELKNKKTVKTAHVTVGMSLHRRSTMLGSGCCLPDHNPFRTATLSFLTFQPWVLLIFLIRWPTRPTMWSMKSIIVWQSPFMSLRISSHISRIVVYLKIRRAMKTQNVSLQVLHLTTKRLGFKVNTSGVKMIRWSVPAVMDWHRAMAMDGTACCI